MKDRLLGEEEKRKDVVNPKLRQKILHFHVIHVASQVTKKLNVGKID